MSIYFKSLPAHTSVLVPGNQPGSFEQQPSRARRQRHRRTSSKVRGLPTLAEPELRLFLHHFCSFVRRPSRQLVVWLAVCDLAVNFTFFLGSPRDGSGLCYCQGFLQRFFQVGGGLRWRMDAKSRLFPLVRIFCEYYNFNRSRTNLEAATIGTSRNATRRPLDMRTYRTILNHFRLCRLPSCFFCLSCFCDRSPSTISTLLLRASNFPNFRNGTLRKKTEVAPFVGSLVAASKIDHFISRFREA